MYHIAPGGQRFLMIKEESIEGTTAPGLIIVQHWFEELKQLVPPNVIRFLNPLLSSKCTTVLSNVAGMYADGQGTRRSMSNQRIADLLNRVSGVTEFIIERRTGRSLPCRYPTFGTRELHSFTMTAPLFVCHANCSRSVLAAYLYRHLCNAPALSAGLEPGEQMSDRAEGILRAWGIDPTGHHPTKLTGSLCREASGIFVMAPSYLHRLLWEHGEQHAEKAYLFADPFSMPMSFSNREYVVCDPSFDERPTSELLKDFDWIRQRVREIHRALLGDGKRLVPVREYLDLCKGVDRQSH